MKLILAIVMHLWSIKNSSEVIEKLRLRNFQGSQVHVSSFDFSTLYTLLPHDLIKAKVLSLVKWCFNGESKSYLCTSLKVGFLATRNMTRRDVGLARSYVKLLLSSWKTYILVKTSNRTLYIHEYNGFEGSQFQCLVALESMNQIF